MQMKGLSFVMSKLYESYYIYFLKWLNFVSKGATKEAADISWEDVSKEKEEEVEESSLEIGRGGW